jgi:hypothetical protein
MTDNNTIHRGTGAYADSQHTSEAIASFYFILEILAVFSSMLETNAPYSPNFLVFL